MPDDTAQFSQILLDFPGVPAREDISVYSLGLRDGEAG